MLDLSLKNINLKFNQFIKHSEAIAEEENLETDLLQMKEDLKINTIPRHIECFDNSNIQGTSPVASMVVFKNFKPSKKDYRRFNIKNRTRP